MTERLLLAAHDPVCGNLRRRILEAGGYEVVNAPTTAETLAVLQTTDFALVLLSHTIPPDDLRQLVEAAKNKSIRTVLIHPTEPPDVGADLCLSVEDPLLPGIGDFLGRQTAA